MAKRIQVPVPNKRGLRLHDVPSLLDETGKRLAPRPYHLQAIDKRIALGALELAALDLRIDEMKRNLPIAIWTIRCQQQDVLPIC